MSARFIGKKVLGSLGTFAFVLVFDFFLFRVVQTDPVGSMFRGRNVPQARLDQMRGRVRSRRLAHASVRAVCARDGSTQLRVVVPDPPTGVG